MLHVTNGDSVVPTIRAAGVPGEVIPWRDVLHEGPVPAGLPLAGLSEVRAGFIAGWAGIPYQEVRAGFAARDAALEASRDEDEVVLWFEHDLYDQLQLLQILDFYAGIEGEDGPRLSLICIDAFPGVERFRGLGELKPADLAALFPLRIPVDSPQLELARRAWGAFRAPDPTAVEALLPGGAATLPFLRPALRRHLEQLPWTRDGLSRTERIVLEMVGEGVCDPVDLFVVHQEREEAPFMGDSTFWDHMEGLTRGARPLLRRREPLSPAAGRPPYVPAYAVELTDDGRRVAAGDADWVELRGGIDRWLGGVHLRGRTAAWRWDGEAGEVRRESPTDGGGGLI